MTQVWSELFAAQEANEVRWEMELYDQVSAF